MRAGGSIFDKFERLRNRLPTVRNENPTSVSSRRRRELGTDQERHWFFGRGLLGENFEWHTEYGQWTKLPSGLERMRNQIVDMTAADPEARSRLRSIALEALESAEADHVRRGVQVLCVLGTDEDLKRVLGLKEHSSTEVVRDVRSCLFERGIKVRE